VRAFTASSAMSGQSVPAGRLSNVGTRGKLRTNSHSVERPASISTQRAISNEVILPPRLVHPHELPADAMRLELGAVGVFTVSVLWYHSIQTGIRIQWARPGSVQFCRPIRTQRAFRGESSPSA
jgi:hypothetical protein